MVYMESMAPVVLSSLSVPLAPTRLFISKYDLLN